MSGIVGVEAVVLGVSHELEVALVRAPREHVGDDVLRLDLAARAIVIRQSERDVVVNTCGGRGTAKDECS